MFALAALALIAAACHPGTSQSGHGKSIPSEPWRLPAPVDASLADLSVTPSNELLLSWVQPGSGDDQALMLSRYASGRWTPVVTVAHSTWFGNAMDTPHVRMTADGTLWAQWLGRNTNGSGHARDVLLSRSLDGGRNWSQPVNVNTDGTATEHGFTALWPASRDRLGIAWLDGRATIASGSTMLRATSFGTRLDRGDEAVVDVSTCDCCRTNAAMTTSGPILAYRGRTAAEVRDIMVARLDTGRWSTPANVHADGWVLKGCPMNGPAIAAKDDAVAVAWYTGIGDVQALRVAYSLDGGRKFGAPVELSRNPRLQGRASTALIGNGTWVTWLDDESGAAVLKLARIDFNARNPAIESMTLHTLAGRDRGAGYSRLAAADGKLYVLWSDVAADRPVLAGAVVSPKD
ncbi:sialidase family protein [Solilutibacter silvestris]|uniref:sialidase family protein n=1 Tax=Solilutibacter silvestris TaxID=1645665 RepID=UPI003D32F98D